MLLKKALELFFENMKVQDLSIYTIENYTSSLLRLNKYLCKEYNRQLYIEEITADYIEKFIFNEFGEEKYSNSSRHNAITPIKSLFSFCYRKRYIDINVGKLIKNVKVETKERVCISEIEFLKLTKSITNPTVRTIAYTVFYAGLRIRECLELTIEDIDLTKDIIMVKEGKCKKDRNIPINERLKKVLIEYLEQGRINVDTNNFFSTKSGKVSKQFVNKVLKKTANELEIDKPVSCHIHRHSFASSLIERGANILLVQKLLGHSSIKTTSVYVHTCFNELQDAVDLL